MEEENKYYTPDISEFYVGFEYEHFSKGAYSKFEIIGWSDFEDISYDLDIKDRIRVKYLGSSDIEDLGFRKVKDYSDQIIFQTVIHEFPEGHSWYELDFDKYSQDIIIEYWEDLGKNRQSIREQLFKGTIKNISELKKVLTQVGVL